MKDELVELYKLKGELECDLIKVNAEITSVKKQMMESNAPKKQTLESRILEQFEQKNTLTIAEICERVQANAGSISCTVYNLKRSGMLFKVSKGVFSTERPKLKTEII